MIRDAKLELSLNQAITTSAPSTDILDFGEISPDRGTGNRVWAECVVTENFTASGDATLSISIQDSADGTNFSDLVATRAIPKSELVKGASFNVDIPEGSHRRYLRLYYTVSTGPFTAGKLTAHLTAA